MTTSRTWIGWDLDKSLAHYDDNGAHGPIGEPLDGPGTAFDLLKQELKKGTDCRIFTARVWPLGTDEATETQEAYVEAAEENKANIEAWCKKHLGRVLPITCVKDHMMKTLYDDRAVSVKPNVGTIIEPQEIINKVSKVGAGYVEIPDTSYRCRDCWKFIPGTRQCAELRQSDRVSPNGYCTLWSFGNPIKGLVPQGAYLPDEVGYGEDKDGTFCKNCEYFEGISCDKVKGLIRPLACCNNQSPRE